MSEQEISVDHDALVSHIKARMAEEYARASDAAESGELVEQFLEETGLNGQAYKWGKTIMKKRPKKDGDLKAMDIIRSLEVILPILKAEILDGQSEMPLGDNVTPMSTAAE